MNERGDSFTEVTAALVLVAIALLAVATLFVHGARSVAAGGRLTGATRAAATIMEEIETLSWDRVYTVFGASASQGAFSADTRTNAHAIRWQPMIDAALPGSHAVVDLAALDGSGASTFGSCVAIRVSVRVEWDEAGHRRSATLQTVRF